MNPALFAVKFILFCTGCTLCILTWGMGGAYEQNGKKPIYAGLGMVSAVLGSVLCTIAGWL